ncbi:NIPSNAP family protein [Sphingomonas sp. RT2P30]|uniref:NIPSNAP family protein n=1 Tax=Parasphingomonas halimpatiens TaxID=3096162 RepID=UPI002FC78E5A
MLYEVTTLGGSVFARRALAGARDWMNNATSGRLLGIWHTDIGKIGEVLILRVFDSEVELRAERHRALMSEDPFGSASAKVTLTMESYALFPFLPDPGPRAYGGTFEIRTYHLTPGGLPGTIDGWHAAIGPAHAYTDHLVATLYALDGLPRITHIWGFESVEERNRLRREHYAAGLWPPAGGPERIEYATSVIATAEPGLPIC